MPRITSPSVISCQPHEAPASSSKYPHTRYAHTRTEKFEHLGNEKPSIAPQIPNPHSQTATYWFPHTDRTQCTWPDARALNTDEPIPQTRR